MPTEIMERLREETAAQHKAAEAKPLEQALVRGAVARETYVAYLAQRFLVHQSLDAKVVELCQKDLRLEGLVPDELLQLPNLRQDLDGFGLDVNEIQPLPATRGLLGDLEDMREREPLALLGAYYVFEGSKNGARFIARALRGALELSGRNGTHYLDPHGEQQRPLWLAFRERMARIDFTAIEQDAMVELAKRTFDHVAAIDDELMEAPVATAAR